MEIFNEKIFRNFYEKSMEQSWNFKRFATFVSNLYDSIVIRKLVEPCHSQQISCTPPSLFDQILIRFWNPAWHEMCHTGAMLIYVTFLEPEICNLLFLHFSCIFLWLVKCIYASLIYFSSGWAQVWQATVNRTYQGYRKFVGGNSEKIRNCWNLSLIFYVTFLYNFLLSLEKHVGISHCYNNGFGEPCL